MPVGKLGGFWVADLFCTVHDRAERQKNQFKIVNEINNLRGTGWLCTLSLSACFLSSTTLAATGLLGLDHRLPLDESGMWSRDNQKAVELGSALTVIAGGLYGGTESRLGRTMWQSVDSMLFADVTAAAAKAVFRRQRPIDGNDPNAFFGSSKDSSFPSGEVTHITAIVTPFILEYQKDTPRVWLLAGFPLYVGVARLKSRAHWQTDVLTGAILGASMGYQATQRDKAWSAQWLPDGLSVHYKKYF
jgi:undecaprenyl-diphosphatase